MSLFDYQRKRRFAHTREPQVSSASSGTRAIFVVQLHHARARHYDFRLQIGDALKSWAIPKGPSLDPKTKRLAVEVEDHPVAYADFEGDIAPGNYGAGHVQIFDRGVWSTAGDAEAQLSKGHLRFELHGERLHGGWHLIRSRRRERQPAWFLIKDDDAFAGDQQADDLLDSPATGGALVKAARSTGPEATAGPGRRRPESQAGAHPRGKNLLWRRRAAALPHSRAAGLEGVFLRPQLTQLRESAPRGDAWLHEVKWDGYRLLAAIHQGQVQLWSRNGLSWNERLPEIVQALAALKLASARFDGELIALDPSGRDDFNALQRTLAGEALAPLRYMLFDLPYLAGFDLSASPLRDRKALLEALLKAAPAPLAYSSHIIGEGPTVFAQAAAQGLEGIVCKRVDAAYHSGRNDDWLKIKRLESDEFAIIGYTQPNGARAGLGALLLGRYVGGGWAYAGRVGSGFSDQQLRTLARQLREHHRDTPPVAAAGVDPLLTDPQWVDPFAVVEVSYRGLGKHGLLRQPSLKALRMDKIPADLHDRDRLPGKRPTVPTGRKTRHATTSIPTSTDIKITHPERLVYPDDGISKQDVVDYYRAVMDSFLPGITGRPTSVIRSPEGIGHPIFFQKHVLNGLHRVEVATLTEEHGKTVEYLCPSSPAAVIELVQFGALEFHPWSALANDPELADRLIFDLDPGPDVAWPDVVAAARLLRGHLRDLALESFLRCTGGKGLHLVLPLRPAMPWTEVRQFAQGFAETLARLYPLQFVAVASKSRRKGRIYLDYLRNGRGATAVASYSLRARPGAPVAVPIRWGELGRLRSADQFDLRSVPRRLARLRQDPWAGIDDLQQDLRHVQQRLEKAGKD